MSLSLSPQWVGVIVVSLCRCVVVSLCRCVVCVVCVVAIVQNEPSLCRCVVVSLCRCVECPSRSARAHRRHCSRRRWCMPCAIPSVCRLVVGSCGRHWGVEMVVASMCRGVDVSVVCASSWCRAVLELHVVCLIMFDSLEACLSTWVHAFRPVDWWQSLLVLERDQKTRLRS